MSLQTGDLIRIFETYWLIYVKATQGTTSGIKVSNRLDYYKITQTVSPAGSYTIAAEQMPFTKF